MHGALNKFHLQLPFLKSSKNDSLLEDDANARNDDDGCAFNHPSSTFSSTKLQSLLRMPTIRFKTIGIFEKTKKRNNGNTDDLFSYVMRASMKRKNMNLQEVTVDDLKGNEEVSTTFIRHAATMPTAITSNFDEASCGTEDHFIELKHSPPFRHFER